MRINKFIASTGICSRRKAEEYVLQQVVKINGKIAELSSTVEPNDVVTINDQPIQPTKQHIVLLFHKPKGVTCTTERHVKGNIIDFIGYPERIFPIGRLDKDSQGLILLTNDGDLVNECLRVENGHEKEYVVKVDKPITPEFLQKLAGGVEIHNPVNNTMVTTLPCQVKSQGYRTFSIILKQGYNRQIRRMCAAFGYQVVSLKRIRFMNLHLDVKEGTYRLLDEKEIQKLKNYQG